LDEFVLKKKRFKSDRFRAAKEPFNIT